MAILGTIVIGFVVGLIAKLLMPGRNGGGFILTTLLGIVGSFVGTYLGSWIGLYQIGEKAGFIGSVLGAMLILYFARILRKNN